MHRIFIVALLTAFSVPTHLHAQFDGAQVLRPGQARIGVGGDHFSFHRSFTDGGTAPLGAEFGGPLTPSTFAQLGTFSTTLTTFLAATDSTPFPVDPAQLGLGDLSVDLSWNTRVLPFSIALGVFPRVEVRVSGSAYRTERFTRQLVLEAGTLGRNPDPVGNANLLAQLDESGTALGNAAVLPLQGSVLGTELHRRVFEASGGELTLPTDPVGADELAAAFGIPVFPGALSLWRPGDVEIEASVQLLKTFSEDYYPAGAGLDLRISAIGGIAVPTGERGLENPRLDWGPQVGFAAYRAGLIGDVFAGSRLWVTASAITRLVSPADVRVAVSGEPIPGPSTSVLTARRDPGRELDVWLIPRFRLTPEISLGGILRGESWGEGAETVMGDETVLPSRSRTSGGLTARYTNLPANQSGRSGLPLEATIGFTVAIDGTAGSEVAGTAFFRVSLLQRLWGRQEVDPQPSTIPN